MSIDLEELAAVIRLIREAEFSEFRYEKGDAQIVVRRGAFIEREPVAAPSAAAPQAATQEVVKSAPTAPARAEVTPTSSAATGTPIKAPLLGTFYASPKPGEPAFVSVGDRVEPDTVVCIIEVMKLMNSVVAGVSGVVTAILAANGDLVEHGQALFFVDDGK